MRPMTLAAGILGALALLSWLFVVATLFTLGNSDPAGNGLAQAYGAIATIVLWLLLAGLTLVAVPAAALPGSVGFAALLLVLLSGAATLAVESLLSPSGGGPRWLLVVPTAAPALVLGFAAWALIPAVRHAVPPQPSGWAAAIGLLLLSLLPWPARFQSTRAADQRRARIETEWRATEAVEAEGRRRAARAKLDSLPPDAPLWEWMELTDSATGVRELALERIRALPRRQADAEAMLARGYGNVARLAPELGLAATPALCDAGRKFLAGQLESIRRLDAQAMPFDLFAERIEPYLPLFRWLGDHGCGVEPIGTELLAESKRFLESPARAALLEAIRQSARR